MEYRRVEKVSEDGVEVFFKGTTYTIREVDGELKIVGRLRFKQQEDPYEPADGRVLSDEDHGIIIRQAAAIIKSRQ